MHQFKKLKAWQESKSFCSKIYQVTANFPESEKFGLTGQLRRAAISIPSNIAEGSSRSSNKDFSRFLQIAIGSAYEIETQLSISYDLKFINKEELEILIDSLDYVIKMMSKFKSTLK